MSFPSHNGFDRSAGAIEAEEALRLIARLPAPEGIEERVKAGLRSAPRKVKVIGWPAAGGYRNSWINSSAMRVAAAAAIVVVVVGGGWETYSHIRVAVVPAAVSTPQPIGGQRGFSTATTKRLPQTLEGPVIPSAAKKTQKTVVHPALASAHGKAPGSKKSKSSVQVNP